jgi:hypothetical protein
MERGIALARLRQLGRRGGDVHDMLLCHQPDCSLNLRGRENIGVSIMR